MRLLRFLIFLAHALKHRYKKDVAFLVSRNRIIGIGFEGDLAKGQTAISELLFFQTIQGRQSADLITTSVPTEMCLGLQWVAGVKNLYFCAEPEAPLSRYVRLENPGNGGFQPEAVVDEGVALGGLPTIPKPTELLQWLELLEASREKLQEPVKSIVTSLMQARFDHLAIPQLAVDPRILPAPVPGRTFVSEPERHEAFMKLAYAIVGMSWNNTSIWGKEVASRSDHQGGFNIGAILVDSNNQIIAWAINQNEVHSTFHAETLMVRCFLEHTGVIPRDCTLYTTLEPCHMCAGLIATMCPGLRVVVGQDDESITCSALERGCGGCSQVLTQVQFELFDHLDNGNLVFRKVRATEILTQLVEVLFRDQDMKNPMIEAQFQALVKGLGQKTKDDIAKFLAKTGNKGEMGRGEAAVRIQSEKAAATIGSDLRKVSSFLGSEYLRFFYQDILDIVLNDTDATLASQCLAFMTNLKTLNILRQ